MKRKKLNKPATDSKFDFSWFAQRTLCNVTPCCSCLHNLNTRIFNKPQVIPDLFGESVIPVSFVV